MTLPHVLVTGGLGYVGCELVRQLVEAGAVEVHILDNFECGRHRLERIDQTQVTVHEGDIRDPVFVADVMEKVKPQTIFHLAAIHFIPACDRDPPNAVGVNVGGTVNLIDKAPKGARFVYASTAAVYAPKDDAHLEDGGDVGPVDIYGFTKLHGEQFLSLAHEQGQIDGVIVRLFNVVGPGETNPHLAPAIIEQLAKGANTLSLGNLFPERDYIDVADAAEGFRRLSVAGSRLKAPMICNLGTGRTSDVRTMVQAICTASGQSPTIAVDPDRVRKVDRPMLKAGTARLRSLTGWVPTRTVQDAMKRAWDARHQDGLA